MSSKELNKLSELDCISFLFLATAAAFFSIANYFKSSQRVDQSELEIFFHNFT